MNENCRCILAGLLEGDREDGSKVCLRARMFRGYECREKHNTA